MFQILYLMWLYKLCPRKCCSGSGQVGVLMSPNYSFSVQSGTLDKQCQGGTKTYKILGVV